jgi:hypothetical protein
VTRDGRLDGLPDPPDGVGNELDAAVGIELPGRGHEAQVALADEVHERDPPVLELLGHADHEPHVVPGQLFLGRDVAAERLASQFHLLVAGKERNAADFLEVQVQTFPPLIYRLGDLGGSNSTPLPAWLCAHVSPPSG